MKKKKILKKVGKKGEIASDSTINMVLLAIGFVILIILISAIAYYYIIKERSCHDSIVMRSSVNYGVFQTSRMIPLQCQTEKICITDNNGVCSSLGVSSKDNYISKDKISTDSEKAKQQVLDKIANSLYQCHYMLGEGQLNFMKQGLTSKNYCLICSRIVLDDKTRQDVGDISYAELYQYLAKKKDSNGKSYLDYLHLGWTDWRSYELMLRKLQENSNDPNFKNLKPQDWVMKTSSENGVAVIAQIAPTGYWKSLAAGGAALVGAAAIASGVGAPAGIALIAGVGGGAATFWYTSPGGKFEYSPPEAYQYDLTTLQNMGCYSFETAP